MSATGDLIAALVAGGMDASEAAGLVARAAVEMTGALTRKSAGAKRQQRYRERNKASQSVTRDDEQKRNEASQSVTALRCDEASQSVTKRNESVTRDDASLSIERKKEEIRKEKRESARGSQLPTGWRPDPESWADAIAVLGSEQRAEYELGKFTDHALEKGRVAKNWNAAWRNWTKRAVEFGGKNGNAISSYRTDPGAGRATAREAQHVASVGDAALRYLRQSKPAGPDRETSRDFGFASVAYADN